MPIKPKPQPSEAQMAARIANIAKARKAKARKAKRKVTEVVEVPLHLVPAPSVRAVAKPRKPSANTAPVELEALAEFTALVFMAIRRRSGR